MQRTTVAAIRTLPSISSRGCSGRLVGPIAGLPSISCRGRRSRLAGPIAAAHPGEHSAMVCVARAAPAVLTKGGSAPPSLQSLASHLSPAPVVVVVLFGSITAAHPGEHCAIEFVTRTAPLLAKSSNALPSLQLPASHLSPAPAVVNVELVRRLVSNAGQVVVIGP